jgi:hypothetical protein
MVQKLLPALATKLLLVVAALASSYGEKQGMATSLSDIDAVYVIHHPLHEASKHVHKPRLNGIFEKHELAAKTSFLNVVGDGEVEEIKTLNP